VCVIGSQEIRFNARTKWPKLQKITEKIGPIRTSAADCTTNISERKFPTGTADLARVPTRFNVPGSSLERIAGCAAGEKLMALAWNRDPRKIRTRHRAQSAGAQSALGRKPAEEQVFRPALRHLADRVASRLRAKSRPGRTVTVRVRFADLHSVTRSVTLDALISATATLAEIGEDLVRSALADNPDEKTVSLLAISVSHLEKRWKLQLELPLGLEDEKRRPGTKRGMARWTADRAIDMTRDRFGWDAVGYGSVILGLSRSVPDEFRELAEKEL
jgi:DNA polymerase-4